MKSTLEECKEIIQSLSPENLIIAGAVIEAIAAGKRDDEVIAVMNAEFAKQGRSPVTLEDVYGIKKPRE